MMNTAEIKIDLFRKLDSLKEKSLQEAYGLLLNYINGNYALDEWANLTPEQQDGIKLAVKQLDNGEGRKHNNVISDFRNRYLNDNY